MPSVAAGGFEEIAMRTLNRPTQPWVGVQDHHPMGGYPHGFPPATPLVKQRTLGCASPRVQMYKPTRVFYSGAVDKPLNPQLQHNFSLAGSKKIPEAAV